MAVLIPMFHFCSLASLFSLVHDEIIRFLQKKSVFTGIYDSHRSSNNLESDFHRIL